MPDVFIIGVTKCATTSLYDMLMQHPEVLKQFHKEPHFHFSKFEGQSFDGKADQDAIEQMFVTEQSNYENLYQGKGLKIDGSAMTIESESALIEIKQKFPNAKIIICLRDPIERAFSAYSHMKRDVREVLPFKIALEEELNGKRETHLPIWHYYKSGLYVDKVRFCRNLFGDNLLLVSFDDLNNQIEKEMRRVTDFLLLTDFKFKKEKSNRSGNPKSKIVQKMIMRKSYLKSLFVYIVPNSIRKNLKRKILNKNTSEKEFLSKEDREYLRKLYFTETKKLKDSSEDDKFLKKIYELV